MTSSADDATWDGLWHRSPRVPHSPLSERTRRPNDLPRTLLPAPPGLRQPVVFDPALKQYADAYRAGEPRFDDPATARTWHRARRTALDTEAEPPGEAPYDRWARWLAPLVAVTRQRAPADPASVLEHLAGGGFEGLAAAVVVVREACGPERVSEQDALAAVLAREDNWRYWRENPQSCRRALELLR